MKPFQPEILPPSNLDLLALMPSVGKANRAIATLEGPRNGGERRQVV
jgi:hypothetical protein